MRAFKTRSFTRFCLKAGLTDAVLMGAVRNVERGLIDADLGGCVFKQRVARPGGGKAGGFRTIIVYRRQNHTFFIYGFAKNDRENIRDDELTALKKLAVKLFGYSDAQIADAVSIGELMEIKSDEKTIS
jgi:hypothetical protein